MPSRFVYSPKVYAYTKDASGVVWNLADYVVSGQVQRLVNQASTASITLRNPGKKFTNPAQGVTFHPMDAITIFLERLEGFPVQVFTGYLDDTPYYQMYPGTVTLNATCTLKKLIYMYFDPSLPYVANFLAKMGWNYGPTNGTLVNYSAISQGTADASKALQDAGIAKLLWAVLTDIGQWDDSNIWIEELPSGKNGIAARIAQLMSTLNTEDQAEASEFTAFMNQLIGAGSQGSGGGSGGSTGGTGVPTSLPGGDTGQKIFNFFTNQGLSDIGAAGIIGNWVQENSLNTDGAGLAQWGGGRFTALQAYAQKAGKPVTDLAVQLGFAWQELTTDFKTTLDGLKAATTAAAAATVFCNTYEETVYSSSGANVAPGEMDNVVNLRRRIAMANDALQQYGSGGAGTNLTNGNNPRGVAITTSAIAGASSTSKASTAGLTNPIPGWTINRDDMGVDASAPVGTPIVAPAACTLSQVLPNWYETESLLLFKFDNTPAGALCDYWYVAEQIDPVTTKIGSHFNVGQAVAHFAASGTGIEIGWGSPTANSRTLAGQMGDTAAANPPAGATTRWGETFKKFFAVGGGTLGTVVGGGPTSGGGSGGGSTGQSMNFSNAEAFTSEIAFPSVQEMATAMMLGNAHKGLMNDQQLLPFIQELTQASLRSFQSLPNGDFFAFYPDYFGETDHRPPYWDIKDIEITNGGINLSDLSLVTHYFAVGDNTYPLNDALVNALFSTGEVTVYNAFMDQGAFIDPNAGTTVPSKAEAKAQGLSNGMADIMSQDEAVAFVQRYGARPQVSQYPMVRSPIYEMFLAYQGFLLAWSNQFQTPFTFTFMPELYPGGKVSFSDHGLQMYVQSVTHEWDFSEGGGFTTSAQLTAPARMDGAAGDNPELPPDMVQALVEPIRMAKANPPPKTPILITPPRRGP